jgi:glycosyltransferase involved in cell wall biosynthesis
VRIQEISSHLNKQNISSTILTPFKEDISNVRELNLQLIPSPLASAGLMSATYKLLRKVANSTMTSGLFLSESSFKRMANVIERGLSKILRANDFDVLHAIQPIASIACAKLAEEYRMNLVSDLHNDWPEEVLMQGLCKRDDRIYKLLHRTQQQIFDFSDAITVVSEELKSYFAENYCTQNKLVTVVSPCGPVIPSAHETTRERNVVYAGMVNFREHVDLFASSIPFVNETANFYISDYGDSLHTIKDITSRLGRKVTYVWFKKRSEVLDSLLRARIGILTSHNDITRQLGPPLKLYDYMACGLPIVANDVGGWSRMIENEGIGLLSKDDPHDFARCIDNLLSNGSMWNEMHENSLRLINTKYNWHSVVNNVLIPLYDNVVRH